MIVLITYVHNDRVVLLQSCTRCRLIKLSFNCLVIHKTSFSWPKPWKSFISKWIDHFDLMIECISNQYDIFMLDKVNSERMLKFSFDSYIINIAIWKQIFRILITTCNVSTSFKSFHINRSNWWTFWVGNVDLYFVSWNNTKCNTWWLCPLTHL